MEEDKKSETFNKKENIDVQIYTIAKWIIVAYAIFFGSALVYSFGNDFTHNSTNPIIPPICCNNTSQPLIIY